MATCERCWSDAHKRGPYYSVAEEYARLVGERGGDKMCTPEQQAGPDATECAECHRRTAHQHCGICMACHYDPVAAKFTAKALAKGPTP